MLRILLSLVLLSGCVKVQAVSRNEDRLVRTQQQKLSTGYSVTNVESRGNPAIIDVTVSETDMCRTTKIFDRTVVTERTLTDKQSTTMWTYGTLGTVGLVLLTVGIALTASGEPAFTDHPDAIAEEDKQQIETPGHLMVWGGLASLMLIPAIHGAVQAMDDRKHVGTVKKDEMPAVCGQRVVTRGGQLAMEHVTQTRLSAEGVARFDLRNWGSEVLEHGPRLTIAYRGKPIGNTGLALQPFYEELERTRESAQRALYQARIEQQTLERREAEALRHAQAEHRAAQLREATARREAEWKADRETAGREAKTRAAKAEKKKADAETARKRRRAEAIKALQEASQ